MNPFDKAAPRIGICILSSDDKMKNRQILARGKPILLFLNKKKLYSKQRSINAVAPLPKVCLALF